MNFDRVRRAFSGTPCPLQRHSHGAPVHHVRESNALREASVRGHYRDKEGESGFNWFAISFERPEATLQSRLAGLLAVCAVASAHWNCGKYRAVYADRHSQANRYRRPSVGNICSYPENIFYESNVLMDFRLVNDNGILRWGELCHRTSSENDHKKAIHSIPQLT